MDERNAFLCYRSFYEAAKHLDKEAQADFLMAVCAYSLDGEEMELTGVAAAMFALVRPTLDTSRKKSASGKHGGSKSKANAKQDESTEEANCKQTKSKTEANTKQGESKAEAIKDKGYKDIRIKDKGYKEDIDILHENGDISKLTAINREGGNTRAKKFAPPTLEEVTAYVHERQSKVDPQGFIDFYASKGWMVGKTPMKDWKAACRNAEKWERWGSSERSYNPFLDMLKEAHNDS